MNFYIKVRKMTKINERVGAILKAADGVVEFLGYGVYVGDFVPKEAAGFMADGLREVEMSNPKIELDDGEVVYGCECWWGSEEKVKKMLETYDEIKYIKISDIRNGKI